MDASVGSLIKDARKDHSMTQAELAQKVGLATITIRQYESGAREPKFDTLRKIAQALDCELTDLVPTPSSNPIYYQRISSNLSEDEKKVLKELDDDILEARMDDIEQTAYEYRQRLLAAFYKLTNKGKEIAVQRLEELAKIPDYRQDFSKLDALMEEYKKYHGIKDESTPRPPANLDE